MTSFAVIPAAGVSRRMGTDKLLLPWGSTTVLAHVLEAWQTSRVDQLVVVTRPDNSRVVSIAESAGADVVVPPQAPQQMRDSVGLGLQHIGDNYPVDDSSVWLMAPADLPGISAPLIDRVLAAHQPNDAQIIVPVVDGRRAHPVLFPWRLAAAVAHLPSEQGVNALLATNSVRPIRWNSRAILADLDSPADYDRQNEIRSRMHGALSYAGIRCQ